MAIVSKRAISSDAINGALAGATTDLAVGRNLAIGAAGKMEFLGRTVMRSPADGIITLANNAETAFTRLNFGGGTSSFVGLGASGSLLSILKGDGSAGGAIGAVRYVRFDQNAFAAAGTAAGVGAGAVAYCTDSTTVVQGATVTGGGANKIIMWSDGTNWKVGMI